VARRSATQKFREILSVLEKHFGRRVRYRSHPPVEQALVTVLLKGGKEPPAMRALQRLEREFVDWNEARVADPEFLDRILGNGYPPGVGRLITDTLTAIFNHAQAMNLDDVMQMPPDRAGARLRKLAPLPGRVAGELLLANLKYPKLPESAGLLRVARRARIISRGSADAHMRTLRRMTSGAMVPRAFHAFEMLAERPCAERGPDCRACPIHDLCPTGVDTLKRLRLREEKERAARAAAEKAHREQKEREKKTRTRKQATTARLKKAIETRSRKLRIPTTGKRKRAKEGAAPKPRMVQASSAHVKRDRTKKRRSRRSRTSRKKTRGTS